MGIFGSRNKNKENAASLANVTLTDGNSYDISNEVDCVGDSCPRPQLMTKKAVTAADSGNVVKILVDNPTSMEALPPMCPQLNATHLETVSGDRGWQVYIQKN
jgi:tRNA 2-thiouridine synthesizing protein A